MHPHLDPPPTAGDDVVHVSVADGVATVVWNRPDRLNAMTVAMEEQYFDALAAADDDPDVRVIIVTGAGRGFCPGLDIDDLTVQSNKLEGEPAPERPATFALTIRKPLIAVVNGAAAGIGLLQALYCDLRFVAAEARLSTAFVRRGLVAELGMSWMLPRLIGRGNALDLLLSGRKFTGEEAFALGLAERVLPFEEVYDAALAYARDLAANCSPIAMAAIKEQVLLDADRGLEAAVVEAIERVADPAHRPDYQEGVAAFAERRAPQFAPLAPRGAGAGTGPEGSA